MLFIKNKIYTVSNNRNERIIKVFFFRNTYNVYIYNLSFDGVSKCTK